MSEIKILNCNTCKITIIDKPEPNELDDAVKDLSKIIAFFTGMRMTDARESLEKSIKELAQAIIQEAKK